MIDLIEDLNKKIESKIDRSKWQKWKFSDLVMNINEKVVPKDSGLKHYIGLEHLDSGSLHIKRFGETSSLIGEKLKIYKDDIIFAKRNAYLKRVAVADFDAVASAHSLVLRAKPKNIVPKFLPFFLLSEIFWKKAIEISVGSLSPTINWPVIARQEFYIPPTNQQLEIAEALWSADNLIQKQELLLSSIKRLISTTRGKHFQAKLEGVKTIGELCFVRAGIGFPLELQGQKDKEVMFFKVGDMNSEMNLRELTSSEHTVSLRDVGKIKAKLHEIGTVVFPKVGAAIATEKKRILKYDSLIDNNVMGVSSKDENLLPPEYLLEFFYTISLAKISNTGTVPSLNAEIIKNIPIYLPNRNVINSYLNQVNSLLKVEMAVSRNIVNTNILIKSLINDIF